MNSLSILGLAAALTLSASPLALAQSSVTGNVGVGTTVEGAVGGTDTSVGAGAGAGVTVDNNGVDLSLDTNADGTVDADEQNASTSTGGTAGGNATGGGNDPTDVGVGTGAGGQTGTDVSLDTDGDGTVSDEERANGEDMTSSLECSGVDLGTTVDAAGLETIASVTSAQIVRLTDCDDETTMLRGDIESAVFANKDIAAMLAAEGVGGGQLRGVTVTNDTVTVYVDDNSDMADGGSAEGTSTK